MLQSEYPDVVHITTPPQSHLPLVRKAVQAGCHVYVEKPLAMNYADACSLINLVELAGKKLTINYWPNFDPPAISLNELINDGVIGDPVHVESYLGYNLSGPFGTALLADAGHWVHKLPGKLFQNNLDHVLNKITPFLPDAQAKVIATAYKRREGEDQCADMPDELRVLIRAGRVSAYATFCSHARPAAHFLKVFGTKNTAYVDFNLRTVTLEPDQTLPSALGRLLPPFSHGWSYLRQGMKNVRAFRNYQFHFFAGMNRLISLFYKSILEDTAVPIPYSEILQVSAMTDQIIGQVFQGVWA
jgi:predicted dehydrogenase